MNAVNTLNMYVLEGLDATGKTTVLKETEETLRKKGYAVLSFSIIHANNTSMLNSIKVFLNDVLTSWEKAGVVNEELKQQLTDKVLDNWSQDNAFLSGGGGWDKNHENLQTALAEAKLIKFNVPSNPLKLSEVFHNIVNAKQRRMYRALFDVNMAIHTLVKTLNEKCVTEAPPVKVAMLVDRYIGSTVQFVNDDLNRHNYMHDMNFNFLLEALSEWHQYLPVDTFGNIKLRWVDLQASLKERKEFAAKRGGFDVADVFESNSFKYHDKMVNKITGYWSDIEEFSKKGLVMEGINFQTKVVKNNIRKPLKKVVQEILS